MDKNIALPLGIVFAILTAACGWAFSEIYTSNGRLTRIEVIVEEMHDRQKVIERELVEHDRGSQNRSLWKDKEGDPK